MTRNRRRPGPLLLVIGVLGGVVLAWVVYATFARSSGSSTAVQVGLQYARTEMVWKHGPSIAHVRTGTTGSLPTLLPALANTTLRQDVNTADLIRRFGPHRKVEIIVLSGVYNSLPPDEGVDVQGEALVLVDVKTNRVIFLTD